jgi:RNA recognition motif-containing protein
MLVILKRISAVTSVPDIESFIEPVIKGGLFKKAGKIKSLKIQMIQEPGAGRDEYHAIVRIEPDVAAQRVIRALNRKPCAGKPINVREFHSRLYANDRRESQDTRFQDARKADRRRKNLVIKYLATDKIGTAISNGALPLTL